MADSKAVMLWIVFSLVIVGIRSELEPEEVILEPGIPDSNPKLQIEQLRSEIASLGQFPFEPEARKWIPAVKEKCISFTAFVEPHLQTVSAKSVEVYEACRSTISPHVVKIQELTSPYVQEARKVSKPYIDQIATVTKPHVEKVSVVLNPYINRVVHAYGKFLESAKTYHQQVQDAVQEELKKHKLTKSLATQELVWCQASAALALPVYLIYKIFLALFW